MSESQFIAITSAEESRRIDSLFKYERHREIARDVFAERFSINTADGLDEEAAKQIAVLEVISLIGRI